MTKFCDDTEVGFCLKSIKHLDNVLMLEVSQNFDLLPQILDVFLTLAVLHDKLHGSYLPSEFAASFVHLLMHPATMSFGLGRARHDQHIEAQPSFVLSHSLLQGLLPWIQD